MELVYIWSIQSKAQNLIGNISNKENEKSINLLTVIIYKIVQ
jgi:hypothetical protein